MTDLLGLDAGSTRSATDAEGASCILIVAAEPAASGAAKILHSRLRAEVEVLTEWSQCRPLLQHRTFDLVVLEEGLASTDSEAVDALYGSLEQGSLVEVSFGVADSERILRTVRSALHRKACNEAHARTAVVASLRNQFSGCLAGLLLEAQLALRQAGPGAAPGLERILALAERLSELVQSSDGESL